MPASTRYPTVLHSKTAVSLGALASARGLTAQGHSPAAGLMHHPQQAAGGPGKHGAASWRALLKIVYLEMIRDCGQPLAGACVRTTRKRDETVVGHLCMGALAHYLTAWCNAHCLADVSSPGLRSVLAPASTR